MAAAKASCCHNCGRAPVCRHHHCNPAPYTSSSVGLRTPCHFIVVLQGVRPGRRLIFADSRWPAAVAEEYLPTIVRSSQLTLMFQPVTDVRQRRLWPTARCRSVNAMICDQQAHNLMRCRHMAAILTWWACFTSKLCSWKTHGRKLHHSRCCTCQQGSKWNRSKEQTICLVPCRRRRPQWRRIFTFT